MRIDQLTEEYASAGKAIPEDVELETALNEFYKKNLAAEQSISQLQMPGLSFTKHMALSITEIFCSIIFDPYSGRLMTFVFFLLFLLL